MTSVQRSPGLIGPKSRMLYCPRASVIAVMTGAGELPVKASNTRSGELSQPLTRGSRATDARSRSPPAASRTWPLTVTDDVQRSHPVGSAQATAKPRDRVIKIRRGATRRTAKPILQTTMLKTDVRRIGGDATARGEQERI